MSNSKQLKVVDTTMEVETYLKTLEKEYPTLAKNIRDATVSIPGAEGLNLSWSPTYLKILQPSSKQETKLNIGTLIDSMGTEVKLNKLIPVGIHESREYFDGKKMQSICSSMDGVTGRVFGSCAECKHKEFKKNSDGSTGAPDCDLIPILVLLDPKTDTIYRTRITTGNREEWKEFKKKVIGARKLNFGYLKLSSVKNANSSNGSYKFEFIYPKTETPLSEEDNTKSTLAINVVILWRQSMLDKYSLETEVDPDMAADDDTTPYLEPESPKASKGKTKTTKEKAATTKEVEVEIAATETSEGSNIYAPELDDEDDDVIPGDDTIVVDMEDSEDF